ncbi:SusC/RagA family TonB-linked outer membrane protein [Carboxylicivirga linearis]|uniref:TonB-dependent receptor n=1 Tax=Carboxylicivirga linearis TaxID=1628157 RepID=A0ABS5K1P1_9BACT|nr:TonB-dependent receptor [Carboxylicivirga linearis]MBS2100584.1 TonB-dependent receptor [Carboxylicivirga linearis]
MKHLLGIFLLFLTITSQAQEMTVTGTVTDASDGMPIPGVSVIVKGTTTGTITTVEGTYSLMVNQGDLLLFSFVGMTDQEITIDREIINVAMESDITDLDEVVVVGYGVKKKALVTGANINVKGDEIVEKNTGTAMEALQGITPGVSITRNNGAPGAGTKVTIRGLGTINNANPLYVVDGIQVDGGIDYLNPSDIESIDVLKDAASSAIYGSRAANGVILVTTKKAKEGAKTRVTYDGYYGVQNIYKNLTPLNAQEYMFIMDEGRTNDGLEPYDWESILLNNSWLNNNYPNELGTQLGEDVWSMLQEGWEGTNWIDEMTQKNAPIQSHSINITGSQKDMVYAIGVSYFDQSGIIGGDITDAGMKRITTRFNSEMVLFKNDRFDIVKIGENFTYNNTENRSVATGNIYWNDLHNALVQNPLMPAYWDESPDANGFTPTLDGLANDQTNPLATMFYRSNYGWGKNNTIVGNVYAEIQPLNGLVFRSSFGINAWYGNSRSWAPTYALGTLYQNANDAVQQDAYQGVRHTYTNTVNYQFRIDQHDISALGGIEMIKEVDNMNVGGRIANTIFGSPEYAYLDNAQKGETSQGIDTWGANYGAQGGGILSYFGRVSYGFKEKYLLDVTVRRDGSSNFSEGNKYGTFPSVSAGWIMSEEDFMSTLDFISFAKLRASWGQNGNERIGAFKYSANMSYINPGYFFGDTKPVSGLTTIPTRVPNPNVTWETSEQLNFGLDARFINSRLGLTVDYYKKTTKDWLVEIPSLGTAGAEAPWGNAGSVENSGFELMLSWNDNLGEFKYGATVTGAFNKNKVTQLDNAEKTFQGPSSVISQGTSYVSRVMVGEPIGYFYGYETDGLLQNQDDVDAYVAPEGAANAGQPYFEDLRPGDVKFVDQNGDGVINEDDKVKIGDPNPDFELGIQLNAEFKGFYASTTLAGKFGMQVMQSYRSFADRFDQNYTTEIFGRWHGEGTSNRIPRLTSGSNRNTNYVSDIYVHDADYLRINNLTVGYKFGKLLSDVDWVQGAKLYVAFNNLYTFTKYSGMDPEVRFGHDASWASGIDLGLYPLPRTVMLGVNVTF